MLIILGALVLLAGWRWRAAQLADTAAAAPDSKTEDHPKPAFLLDLNSADTTALMEIKGIGPASARRIVRYRSLIGGFTKTDQLLKVWGITPENFIRIEEQVFVDTTGKAFFDLRRAFVKPNTYRPSGRSRDSGRSHYQDHPFYDEQKSHHDRPYGDSQQKSFYPGESHAAPSIYSEPRSSAPASSEAPARRQLLDINTADSTALLAINGIGAGTARNILKYRSLIYFFDNLDQLSEVWGVRPENLERMRPYLTVGESRKTMPHLRINEMTVDEMGRHKYLGFKEARILVAYREMHGAFADFEAVQKVLGIAPEKLTQLKPYFVY